MLTFLHKIPLFLNRRERRKRIFFYVYSINIL